jgi:capsid protein
MATKTKRKTPLQSAQEREQIARLNLQTKLHTRRLAVLNKYDVVETNRRRRQASKETKSEGGIYDMTRRLRGCNLGRDLERNYSPAKGIMHQIRVNVIGSLGKMKINLDGAEHGADWFNQVWAKDCDYRTGLHWSDWLQNTLDGILRDGDQLTVFDDGIIENGNGNSGGTGKLITWESDQVVPAQKGILEKPWDGLTQDNGILRDKWGVEKAYLATGKRGLTMIGDLKDLTVFPRGPAKLMRLPWRQNQGRGVPILITPASNFIDLYELLASELQSAKRSAKQYAHVKRKEAVADWDDPTADPEFLGENLGKTAAVVDAEGANEATATGALNYEKLEALTGGYTDYVDENDEIIFPEIRHPNKEVQAFIEAVHGFGGTALGIASAYTKLRADKSYTAFRGDMIMTWATWYWLQKLIERMIADWVGRRVLAWAVAQGKIKPLPEGWELAVSWTWPTMPEVDKKKAQDAIAQALKNGTTDFSELLGPDWEKRLRAYGKQIELIRELLLPLGVLETKAGAPAAAGGGETKPDGDEE